jgi:hypothetical protein
MSSVSAKTTAATPVEKAFEIAPEDDLPETEEERRMVAEARANFARHGRTRTPEQIKATIEEMRRRQEGE